MFGLIDVAFGLAVSKCLVWAMVGSFFLLPPFAFVAFGAYRCGCVFASVSVCTCVGAHQCEDVELYLREVCIHMCVRTK